MNLSKFKSLIMVLCTSHFDLRSKLKNHPLDILAVNNKVIWSRIFWSEQYNLNCTTPPTLCSQQHLRNLPQTRLRRRTSGIYAWDERVLFRSHVSAAREASGWRRRRARATRSSRPIWAATAGTNWTISTRPSKRSASCASAASRASAKAFCRCAGRHYSYTGRTVT